MVKICNKDKHKCMQESSHNINSKQDNIRMFNYLYKRYVESLERRCVGQKNMKRDCVRGQMPEIDEEETYDRVKNL